MPPRIDTTVDGHVHTRLCHHACGEMEDYVLAGLDKGLKEIVFLEHLETGINYFETTWLSEIDFTFYFQEGRRLQKKYAGRIKISLGVEVGYNPDQPQEILSKLADYPWDRIGLSYHFLKHQNHHLNLVSSKKNNIEALDRLGVDRVLTAYFTELTKAVTILPGNVLCHFDAVLRHHPACRFISTHNQQVETLLDVVAHKGMAVEVNASGFPLRGEPYPSFAFLKKVIKRRIPLVAGSDAHRPEDVGRFFKQISRVVTSFG